jgi:hypothetical protein
MRRQSFGLTNWNTLRGSDTCSGTIGYQIHTLDRKEAGTRRETGEPGSLVIKKQNLEGYNITHLASE